MDIDKLIQRKRRYEELPGFGSLMDIDKLIQVGEAMAERISFGSLMDIDKLIPTGKFIIIAEFWFSDGY